MLAAYPVTAWISASAGESDYLNVVIGK